MLTHWKTLSSKTLFKNPWWTYKVDTYDIPGRISGEYHFVHTEGASMVIPVRDDGKIILVNQYRYLCNRESIEFPCGGVKQGRTYEEMAMLELEEETGYHADRLERIAEFNPYNGVTNEICAVFLGRKLSARAARPDDTEEFEIVACTRSDLEDMISHGTIWDGMTLAAWALAKEKIL